MNVNIWGPCLWEILHGFATLCNQNNFKYFNKIFLNLLVLLPCIHCLNSYKLFYENPPNNFSSNVAFMKYVYDLHNKVNDKLNKQKGNKLINPPFSVILKRAAISENKPFCENNLWKVLFAFSLKFELETFNDFIEFIQNASEFLRHTEKYVVLSQKLSKVVEWLKDYFNQGKHITNNQTLFNVLVIFRDNRNIENYAKEKIRGDELFHIYMNNVPAGSCGYLTCQ